MNYIQNSIICQPTLKNKAIAGMTCALTIGTVALFIIGLTAPQCGPFNLINQLGPHHNGILLGTSIFLFVLDLVWLAAIKKNNSKMIEQVIANEEPPCPLPKPLIKLFLSYLDPETLEQVARGWKQTGGDETLWNAFKLEDYCPKLTIFGAELWENNFSRMGLNARDIKPIDGHDKRALIPVLKVLSPQVEGDAGITLLTIPKGLTFNKLVAFAKTLTGTRGTIFRYIWDKFQAQYGSETVPETYRVVLTNNVLKGTRNLSIQAQKKLIDELEIGCDFPKVIELCTLLIATLVTSNNRLLNDGPWTFSRCDERIDDWQLHVGGFVRASGFDVDFSHFGSECYGLVGRRKLKNPGPIGPLIL